MTPAFNSYILILFYSLLPCASALPLHLAETRLIPTVLQGVQQQHLQQLVYILNISVTNILKCCSESDSPLIQIRRSESCQAEREEGEGVGAVRI